MGNGEESLLNQIPNKAVFITFMTLFVIDRQMNSEREKSAIKTYFVNDFRHHNQNICLNCCCDINAFFLLFSVQERKRRETKKSQTH